jgi:nickel/cobalt exporter
MTTFTEVLQQGTSHAWLFIPTAIVLGALHGLEPGHSKTMMAAFIIAIRGTIFQAVLLGVSAAISHSLIIWLLAAGALRYGAKWNAEKVEPYFHLLSAVIILALAAWMFWRTRRSVRAAHEHHHHHHHHGHDDVKKFETPWGEVKLTVFEKDVPPVFRLIFPETVHQVLKPADVTVETLRIGGAQESYAFAVREGYFESTTEIPEPHEFDLTLRVTHEGKPHLYLAQFREHDHSHDYHHVHGADYEDEHEAEHAAEIRSWLNNRQVTTAQIIAFGLTGGLMPCPAAFTVLLVCLQVKQFTLGFALVGAFSFGLALTMVSVGVIAAWSVHHAEKKFRGFGEIMRKAPYVSCVVLVVLAGFLAWQGWHGLASLRALP